MKKTYADNHKPTTAIAGAEAVPSKQSTNTRKPSENATNPRKAATGAGDLYSPPSTRSQKDRCKKEMEKVEDSMSEASKPSKPKFDADTGRSDLKELRSAPRAKGARSSPNISAGPSAASLGHERARDKYSFHEGQGTAKGPAEGAVQNWQLRQIQVKVSSPWEQLLKIGEAVSGSSHRSMTRQTQLTHYFSFAF
ncbi:uncharacterized protein LOC144124232 [Amblyomma americanum]